MQGCEMDKCIPKFYFVEPWASGKWYERSLDNDSNELQRPIESPELEVPNKRDIFHFSKSRFALPSKPVAYLTINPVACAAEITESFRQDENLSLFDGAFSDYLGGNFDPTPEKYLHTRHFFIQKEAKLLDLRSPGTADCILMSKKRGRPSLDDFYSAVVVSRNPACYDESHAVAEEACKRGLHGILYMSVRMPHDHAPVPCAVIFDREIITEYSYSEWQKRKCELEK